MLLNVIAKPDPRDWTSLSADGRDWTEALDGGVKGLRIAFSRTLGYFHPDPKIERTVENAVAVHRDIGDDGLALIDPVIRARVERLEKTTLAEVVKANERQFALALTLNRFHEKYDLLVTPVQSKPRPHVGTAPEAPYTLAINLTHQPAASVPAGFDANGLPVGLQVCAPLYADALTLRAARAFERARPFVLPQLSALRRERKFG